MGMDSGWENLLRNITALYLGNPPENQHFLTY